MFWFLSRFKYVEMNQIIRCIQAPTPVAKVFNTLASSWGDKIFLTATAIAFGKLREISFPGTGAREAARSSPSSSQLISNVYGGAVIHTTY